MNNKENLIKELKESVVEMEDEEIIEIAEEYINEGHSAYDGIMDGLVDGMNEVSELYNDEEYFITDVLLASDAMYAGLDILRPHLEEGSVEKKVKAVIGVVEGDTHDIGKNLVKIMMETAGFEMIDLGRDVPLNNFIEVAEKEEAELICMSTLMTTTMEGMKEVVNKLKESKIVNKAKIMIGGGPISQKFAEEIGADGYSSNAVEAVRLAKKLVSIE